MPTMLKSLKRLTETLQDKGLHYMVIGGYALPFYGRIRTTLDIDLAVMVDTRSEFKKLLRCLEKNDFEATLSSYKNPLVVLLDLKDKVAIELWLKPDGVVFDDQLLKRRKKVKLDTGIETWIISPEDFIVNKLARPDRGVKDEKDVKSVLIRQKGNLDYQYLEKRARNAGVYEVLEKIKNTGNQ